MATAMAIAEACAVLLQIAGARLTVTALVEQHAQRSQRVYDAIALRARLPRPDLRDGRTTVRASQTSTDGMRVEPYEHAGIDACDAHGLPGMRQTAWKIVTTLRGLDEFPPTETVAAVRISRRIEGAVPTPAGGGYRR